MVPVKLSLRSARQKKGEKVGKEGPFSTLPEPDILADILEVENQSSRLVPYEREDGTMSTAVICDLTLSKNQRPAVQSKPLSSHRNAPSDGLTDPYLFKPTCWGWKMPSSYSSCDCLNYPRCFDTVSKCHNCVDSLYGKYVQNLNKAHEACRNTLGFWGWGACGLVYLFGLDNLIRARTDAWLSCWISFTKM